MWSAAEAVDLLIVPLTQERTTISGTRDNNIDTTMILLTRTGI